ncbi:MAG: hypothetical protein BWK76_10875 [Desulfobulbaceae bacterium A2]|nr:MAG: hypothetical protein BWK76_10875 [Desulfobulbaceae bacterium A2]
MAGQQLTTASTVLCPHGGVAQLVTANTAVSADHAAVLLESDIHSVSGCPFMVGNTSSPCVRITWSAGSARALINGTASLLTSSIGQCCNAAGVSQGVAIIGNTQMKASAQ